MSRAAALGLAATAVAAIPAQAAVEAPSGGRAYERVSPQGTSSPPEGAAVSDDGTQVLFRWGATLPQASNGFVAQNAYLAQRSESGWSMGQAFPSPPGVRPPDVFTVDLSDMRMTLQGVGPASAENTGAFRREVDGSITELVRAFPSAPFREASLVGASADQEHVVMFAQAQLAPGALAPPAYNLYDVTSDGISLVSVEPDGTPMSSMGPTNGQPNDPEAVSRDGRVIVFRRSDGNNALYARVDGTDTVELSESQRTPVDPAGPQTPRFEGATADASRIYLSSQEALTNDAETDGGNARALYEYDLETGDLRTITPGFGVGVSPDIQAVVAVAPDGSRVYYVARAALPGSGAADGAYNLYRYDTRSGGVRYLAALEPEFIDGNGTRFGRDTDLFQPDSGRRYFSYRPTEDGRILVFQAYAALTGAESTAPDGSPRIAVYRYDDDTGDITCLSCGAPGTRANGDSGFTMLASGGDAVGMAAPAVGNSSANPVFTRSPVMSTDGRRIFFTTRNALVGQDVNGRADVYQWSEGRAQLISPGTGAHDARFEGISPGGDDVVFATTEPLVGADSDVLSDLYDARVGGGFAEPPPPLAPCTGDACKGAPTRLASPPVAASISFAGPATVDVPRLTPPAKVAKLTLAGRSIRGTTVTVKVKVNAAGRLSVSGARIVTVRRTATRAGTYAMRVRLNAKARRSLKRHGRLKVGLRVGYVPKQGRASSKIFSVSLKG